MVIGSHVVEMQVDEHRQLLKSHRNSFGLFCVYHAAAAFPLHDPEEFINLDASGLSDIQGETEDLEDTSFGPYPNHSSFALGEWYWGGGA